MIKFINLKTFGIHSSNISKIIAFSLLLPFIIQAQNSFKAIIKDAKNQDALLGATVIMEGTHFGAASDSTGIVKLNNIPDGKHTLIFRLVGYETLEKTFQFSKNISESLQTIYLNPKSESLDEIMVTSTRTNSRIEDIPIRIEVIGKEEVDEEANIKPSNISKLLLESPSIQMQQTSAVTGNMSVRLLGLDGKYTQIMKDGFPLYGGFSQGLSVLEIPPLDLKQVEIIKGSASSLYGSDAIAGIVNLISKKPQEKRELTLLLNQSSLKGTDVNAYYSQRFKKTGISVLASGNLQQAVDVSKNGFSDLPQSQSLTINPTFYFYFNPTATLQFGLNGTLDQRKGGDMRAIYNPTQNPTLYFENNTTNRYSTQLKFEKNFGNNVNLTLKNSISNFDRSISQPLSTFAGNQLSSYSEGSFSFHLEEQQIVAGLNFNTDRFTESKVYSHPDRDYNYTTGGIFLQDDWKPIENLVIEGGLRTDYQNHFGVFVLPRIAVIFHFNKEFYMRAGSGMGYKIPTLFSTESEVAGLNFIQPLSGSIQAEKSTGGNLDFNYKNQIDDEHLWSFNQSFFVTQIDHPLVLQGFSFISENKPVLSAGFESDIRLNLDQFQIFAGYTFVDARREYEPSQSFIPLTPKHKLNLDLIYEIENNISVAAEGYYVSSMFRDGDTNTKPYFTVGLIVQKHFKHFSLIANAENLLDVRQTQFEDIVIPPITAPTFKQIYAPLAGRTFNIALRIKI
jgi:iron complex outermembrane receptor protein